MCSHLLGGDCLQLVVELAVGGGEGGKLALRRRANPPLIDDYLRASRERGHLAKAQPHELCKAT